MSNIPGRYDNDPLQRTSDSNIPMFNQHGTAYSHEEREAIAKKRGICVMCGVKTHEIKFLMSKPLTGDYVFEGICIRDYPAKVPQHIYHAWEIKFKPQPVHPGKTKLKSVAATVFMAQPNRPHAPNVVKSTINAPMNNPSSAQVTSNNQNSRQPYPTNQRESSREQDHRISRMSPPLVNPSHGAETVVHEVYNGGNCDDDLSQLLKALHDNLDKPTVLKQKLHRLRNLGANQAGPLYRIKDVMDHCNNDSRLMAVACGALWSVTAQNDEAQAVASGSGIISDVVDVLRRPSNGNDTDLTVWAIGCLSCLSHGIGNRGTIADAGGIEAIIAALQRHSNSAAVFEWSARALHSLVYCYEDEGDSQYLKVSDTAIRKNIVDIYEADGIQALVASMKKHTSETISQMWAIKVLWRLQDRKDEAASRRVIQKMSDENSVQVFIKVLKARSTTSLVYEFTASLMFNVLAGSRNQTLPDEAADCLRTTLRMMVDYPDNESLQEACCRLLSALANRCNLQIQEANGLATVVAAMTNFPTNLELQESCSWVLWSMSYRPAIFDYSVVGAAFRTLEAAARTHKEAVTLLTGTCGIIANLVLSSNVKPQDIPVEIPILALSLRVDERRLFDEAGRAIANMCIQSSTLARTVVDKNGIQALVDCLQSCSGSTSCGVLSALSNIANVNDDNKKVMIQAGCLLTAKFRIQESGSSALTEKALELISIMVSTEKRSAIQLPNDIFDVIVQAMRGQLKSGHSMEIACGTLRNLLCVSTPGALFIFDDIIESMTELVNDQSCEVQLKVEACKVLWALTARHPIKDTSQLSKMFTSILGCIKFSPGDGQPFNSELQCSAAGTLASIVNCMRDTDLPVTIENVEEIVAVMYMAMEYDPQRVEVLERYLDVLVNLSLFDENLVIQAGGIVVVIDIMVERENAEYVQEQGCAILAMLSSTENLQVNLCIAETDGIDMIVNALAKYSSNQRIQVDACRALSHLSVDQESRMLMASQGGLLLLINAMTCNQDNIDLLEGACSALLNLTSDAEEQVLTDSNVVETVVNLMKYHPDAPLLHEKALGVLQNVSMRNANAKASICDAGGIEVVAATIKEFMGSPSVLERAFTTLWSLAVLEKNQVEIGKSGGIGLVVNGMMANIESEKVQIQACGCLCVISSNSRNKAIIREAGGVDAIVYAMWAHYDSEFLQIEACKGLSSLAVNVQTNEVMLATDGEINAIISAMRLFPTSEKLQENACIALRNFMLSQDNADLISSSASELIGLLQRAASRFPDKCRDRANQVVVNLQ